MSTQRVCCAGFGGQGVLSMGKLLAYAGMLDGKEVSWCPSYGPEMRGGTANCSIVVSDEPVGSPVITADATASIVMNQPSYDKFVEIVGSGGTIIINSSLVEKKVERNDVKAYYVPANEEIIFISMPDNCVYQTSGNNIDGFIITVWRKNDD